MQEVVQETRIFGSLLPPSPDMRIEGPVAFVRARHVVLRRGGRGLIYQVSVTLRVQTTYGTSVGTVQFHCIKWPGVIEMTEALQRDWYISDFLARAVSVYARNYLTECNLW